MPQLLALWRDTKWLWLLFVVLAIAAALFWEPLCVLTLPVLPFMYAYFAFNRYDASGRAKVAP